MFATLHWKPKHFLFDRHLPLFWVQTLSVVVSYSPSTSTAITSLLKSCWFCLRANRGTCWHGSKSNQIFLNLCRAGSQRYLSKGLHYNREVWTIKCIYCSTSKATSVAVATQVVGHERKLYLN